jgi:VCBS repeat-containing protein
MTVNDDGADSPVISGTTTVNGNEDGVNAADGALTPIAVSVSALDGDNAPSYDWDVTASNDGMPVFSVANVATPTLLYTPLANDNGSPADTFTIRVCDGGSAGTGNCDFQVITVNLIAQQDTPVAVNDTGVNVLEGAASTLLTVISNDTDADVGQAATLIPNLASISITSGGLSLIGVTGNQIEVSHNGAEESSASLTYKVQDVNGRISALAATVSITITASDDPPTSANITVAGTVDEGTSTIVNAIAVSNDPEGATMAVCNTMTAPTSGNAAVTINGGGNIVYTHDGTDVAGGGEVDTFTYQVNDANDSTCASGNNSGFSVVTVNLAAVNDRPVAVADLITVAEGATVTILDNTNTSVLTNDTDEENGVGTGFTVSANSMPGFNNGFTLNSDGTFSYTHDGSENLNTSFTYTVNDGTIDSASPGTVTINVNPVNDPPVITSTAPTTALVLTEQVAANVYQLTQTDNDDVAFSYDLGATALSGDIVMAINNSGLITWTPPRTGNFNQATAMVTVTVTDAASTEGGNNKTDTQIFNIATSPLDSDNDGVADYSDNCPATSNAGQADLDSDTTHILPQTDPSGIPANGDVDPAGIDANGFDTGGDACDTDEDGDGIPDSIEDNSSFPFLDSRNPADAALDEDGDGLSNLDEYRNDTTGATIDSDSVAPIVDAPDDITINATGLLTAVDIGTATAIDGNDGEVTLFKVALNSTAADCDALTNLDSDIESFRPGRHTVTWVTCDSSKNLGSDNQVVNVKPLVSLSSGQAVGEGQTVRIDVVLNGDAIAYPATVDYTLTGTAVAGDDHDGVAGTVSIAAKGDVGTISFNTLSDGVVEGDETVIVTLSSPSNIALSNATEHTVTITEANVAPKVILQVTQAAAMRGNAIYQPDGNTLILANANDGNGDTLSYDWSASDATLFGVSSIGGVDGNQLDINPATLTLDAFYSVSVTVTDGVSPITIDRLLQVKGVPVVLTAVDSDGDGINDDDPAEGFADDDADGIPNYLDNISTPANAIENHTVNLQTSVLIETNPGLHIAIGETAVAAEATGVLIGLQDIVDHGGSGGNAVSNAATDYTFLSALLNFEVSGLTENIVSVNVVVPLQSAIQAEAVVRKYNSTGWFDFVVDDFNEIRSAPGVGGVCPQPGSDLYTTGLTVGYLCLQLTIQDGGANDADGVRNFIVKDPGGLALAPEPDESEVTVASSGSSSGRIGSTSLWFLLMFLMCATYLLHTRKVKYKSKL